MFEDWSFAHLSRTQTLWGPHGYHRYPAKFIPQLVHRLIDKYSEPSDLVGDPFLGSATTGVESLRLGRRFVGSDVSQVAVLISRAKCTPLNPCELEQVWQSLNQQLDAIPRIDRRPLSEAERQHIAAIDIVHARGEERLGYWFPAIYRERLEAILQFILACSHEPTRYFLLCGFSNILKHCSIWLSGSTKAQKDLGKMLGDPIDEFRKQVRDMLLRNRLYWDDIQERGMNPVQASEYCRIDWGDARRLPLPDSSIDFLVTSPPYAICYEYKEIHQLTQLWFEHYGVISPPGAHETWIGSKGLTYRSTSGTSTSCATGSVLADAALLELARLAVGRVAQGVSREVRALRYYFQDMHESLRELVRVTVPGKRIVLIIGNSYRRGITIPTSEALSEMMECMDVALERHIVRRVPARVLVSTRDKHTGRFSSTARSDTQVYPEEHVLVFQKPPI